MLRHLERNHHCGWLLLEVQSRRSRARRAGARIEACSLERGRASSTDGSILASPGPLAREHGQRKKGAGDSKLLRLLFLGEEATVGYIKHVANSLLRLLFPVFFLWLSTLPHPTACGGGEHVAPHGRTQFVCTTLAAALVLCFVYRFAEPPVSYQPDGRWIEWRTAGHRSGHRCPKSRRAGDERAEDKGKAGGAGR